MTICSFLVVEVVIVGMAKRGEKGWKCLVRDWRGVGRIGLVTWQRVIGKGGRNEGRECGMGVKMYSGEWMDRAHQHALKNRSTYFCIAAMREIFTEGT
jgi:hypothetical protein